MTSVTIPTSAVETDYQFSITLGVNVFQLRIYWNTRVGAWYHDLLDSGGAPIRTGIKIVVGIPLWRKIATTGRPVGELMAIDSAGTDIDPGLTDLGNRVQLVYTEP
jgi:hypothetical protein